MISLISDMPGPAGDREPSTIIFDIETAPLPLEKIEHLMPEFEAPSNYKDLEKIRAAKEEKRLAWIERAALSPVTGQVVAIGAIVDGVYRAYLCEADPEAEADALRWFWTMVGVHTALIGFNSHRFDLPFLVRRSWSLGVDVPVGIISLGGRFFRNSFDLMESWQLGDRGELISLDRLAKFLGVGEKSGNGADFARLLRDDPEAAGEYLRNDVELTARCAARLGLVEFEEERFGAVEAESPDTGSVVTPTAEEDY